MWECLDFDGHITRLSLCWSQIFYILTSTVSEISPVQKFPKKLFCDVIILPLYCRLEWFIGCCCPHDQMHFVAEIPKDSEARIFIDDVEKIGGFCPASFSCSFDEFSEDCDWQIYNDGTTTLMWLYYTGSLNDPNSPRWVLKNS